MAEKRFNGSPFGVQTARFDVSGIHPKSKTPGTFTQTPYCNKATSKLNTLLGPGRYDVDYGGFNEKAVRERCSGPGWARAFEVSRMASMPHLLHKDQWELKKHLQRKLGPGSYEASDFLNIADQKPKSTRGIIQTREERFKEKRKSEIPGPGTYGAGGIPHALKEEKEKQSVSTVGMLDAGSPSRSLPAVGSHLGPGSYNFISFTDQNSQRVTSLRGPFDLFSGDRNKPIKTGHFAAPSHDKLGPGQYEIRSFLDELNSEHKKQQGKFGKMDQHPYVPSERIYCSTLSQNPRKPSEPGPGSYDPPMISKPLVQAKKTPGFLSSSQRSDRLAQKFFTRNFNPVGPGRYDIQKWEDAQHRNGHNSMFKSKTVKPDATREKFLQERIRAKDMRPQERVHIVPPDNAAHFLTRGKTFTEGMGAESYMIQRSITCA